MPMVSVVMRNYNYGKYIAEAIESVLGQSFKDLELIIVDDASTDNSRQIIRNYVERDKRVKAIFHERNSGISRTHNDGVDAASGKFLSIIDSDDLWVYNKLERQLSAVKNNEDLVVWSDGDIIDGDGRLTGKKFIEFCIGQKKKKSGDIFEELLMGNHILCSSLLFKRENLGGIRFDESLKYINDYMFEVDMAKKYPFHFIPECLAKYRIHGANTISSENEYWYTDRIKAGTSLLQKYGVVMSNKARAKILFWMGKAYDDLGDRITARKLIHRAMRTYPLDVSNLIYLTYLFTKKDGRMRKAILTSSKRLYDIKLRLQKA
jgi:glycosyltransferase involved in cell wall biosynthesis